MGSKPSEMKALPTVDDQRNETHEIPNMTSIFLRIHSLKFGLTKKFVTPPTLCPCLYCSIYHKQGVD